MPIFFMKILMSDPFTLPCASLTTVMSREPKICRVARDIRSTYWDEIFSASAVIFASSATARSCAAGASSTTASI